MTFCAEWKYYGHHPYLFVIRVNQKRKLVKYLKPTGTQVKLVGDEGLMQRLFNLQIVTSTELFVYFWARTFDSLVLKPIKDVSANLPNFIGNKVLVSNYTYEYTK